MRHKLYAIILIFFSSMFIIAANYSSRFERSPNATAPYGRLLSDSYKVIANFEKTRGSYDNEEYFKSRINQVANANNPRPLTTGGIVQNKKNRRELRLQRFELERFINGYAGRYAPKEVSMMHAAFDCRVRNIEINPALDRECKQLFEMHKRKADRIVNQRLNMPKAQPVIQAQPKKMNNNADTMVKTQRTDLGPIVIDRPKQAAQPEIMPIPPQDNVGQPDIVPAYQNFEKLEPTKQKTLKNAPNQGTQRLDGQTGLPVPIKNPQDQEYRDNKLPPLQQPKTNDKIRKEAEQLKSGRTIIPVVPTPIEDNSDTMSQIPSDMVPASIPKKKFNPLDYIHPSLRKRALEEMRLKNPEAFIDEGGTRTQMPAPDTISTEMPNENIVSEPKPKPEPEPEPEPEIQFGIKPTSPISVANDAEINSSFTPISPSNFQSTVVSSEKVRPIETLKPEESQTETQKIIKTDSIPRSRLKNRHIDRSINRKLPKPFSYRLLDQKSFARAPIDKQVYGFNKPASLENYEKISTGSILPKSSGQMKVTRRPEYIVIPFSSALNIKKSGQEILRSVSKKLGNYNNIIIKGHADQGSNNKIDAKMSLKRAQKIRNLVKKFAGNTPISLQALGASEPLAGLSKYNDRNRRVEIMLQ